MDIINSYKEYIDKIICTTFEIGEPAVYKKYIFDVICYWLSAEFIIEHIDNDTKLELIMYAKERLA